MVVLVFSRDFWSHDMNCGCQFRTYVEFSRSKNSKPGPLVVLGFSVVARADEEAVISDWIILQHFADCAGRYDCSYPTVSYLVTQLVRNCL